MRSVWITIESSSHLAHQNTRKYPLKLTVLATENQWLEDEISSEEHLFSAPR